MTAISTTKRFALLLALMAAMLLACAGAASAQTQTLTSTVKQSGYDDFNPNPVPINGSPYDYSGQGYASLVSIDQVSITMTLFDGDTGPGDFDRDQLTLGLDGIDTGIKLNDFLDETTTTQTITGVPNNAADILAALQADGQLNATVIDQSPDDNILTFDATIDTTLVITQADHTPPTVTDTTPDGTASKTATVTATFSEPVENVTTDTFILERNIAVKKTDPPKYVLVDATVELSTDGLSAVLTPVEDLPKGTYRATITTDVTDEAGNALEEPVVWTFTVAK
jgi:Bacterial Ig-like domain